MQNRKDSEVFVNFNSKHLQFEIIFNPLKNQLFREFHLTRPRTAYIIRMVITETQTILIRPHSNSNIQNPNSGFVIEIIKANLIDYNNSSNKINI